MENQKMKPSKKEYKKHGVFFVLFIRCSYYQSDKTKNKATTEFEKQKEEESRK